MVFDTKSAAEAGRKGGAKGAAVRWGNKDPNTVRSVRILIAVSPAELEEIDAKAKDAGLSRGELIIRATRAYSS